MSLRARSSLFCSLAAGLLVWLSVPSRAQTSGPHVVSIEPPQGLVARRGAALEIPLKLNIRGGYHINSNTPAEDYLIPTVLSWEPGPLAARGVTYPRAEVVNYEFSSKPLQVYSRTVTVVSRFAAAADAARGPVTLSGKLRYQACTDKMCLAPRTLEISIPVKIE